MSRDGFSNYRASLYRCWSIKTSEIFKIPIEAWPELSDRPWSPVRKRNIGRVRSLERVVLTSHRIRREKVSGLGEVAECVASASVQHARVHTHTACTRHAHAYAHTHTHTPTPWRTGDGAVVVVHSTRNQSLVRALTSEVEKERERERKRESDRKTRTSGTEVRGASFPSDMPGCLLVLSHRLRPTSLPLRAPRPSSGTHSLFSFPSLAYLVLYSFIFIYFHLYLANCFVAKSRQQV